MEEGRAARGGGGVGSGRVTGGGVGSSHGKCGDVAKALTAFASYLKEQAQPRVCSPSEGARVLALGRGSALGLGSIFESSC